MSRIEVWLSLVEHYVRDVGAASSNLGFVKSRLFRNGGVKMADISHTIAPTRTAVFSLTRIIVCAIILRIIIGFIASGNNE